MRAAATPAAGPLAPSRGRERLRACRFVLSLAAPAEAPRAPGGNSVGWSGMVPGRPTRVHGQPARKPTERPRPQRACLRPSAPRFHP